MIYIKNNTTKLIGIENKAILPNETESFENEDVIYMPVVRRFIEKGRLSIIKEYELSDPTEQPEKTADNKEEAEPTKEPDKKEESAETPQELAKATKSAKAVKTTEK